MNTPWKLRLYMARLLLGAGPVGYDLCFRKNRLTVRRQRILVDGPLHITDARFYINKPEPEYIADGVPIIT